MPVKVKTAVESRECAFYRMGLRGLPNFVDKPTSWASGGGRELNQKEEISPIPK
jgi:hypothetical protein